MPFSLTSFANPTVPPAPERLNTSNEVAILASSNTFPMVRAVTSYPPPGELGTIIRRPDTGPLGLALAAAVPEPELAVAPQAAVSSTAAATPTLRSFVRICPRL